MTEETLPENWIWTTLGEVCLKSQYGWTTSASDKGTIRLLRTTDITSGNINWNDVPFCKEIPNDVEKYSLKDGDIVISRAGSVGYSHLIKSPKSSVFASYLIRFIPLIHENYVSYFLKGPLYWNSISEKSLGIAVPNVNATKLREIHFPLPPLPEQRAIVSKIELLFSELDNGIANLKLAQEQLKVYRQAVLKKAFEGELTKEWREQQVDLPSADELLVDIQREREEAVKNTGKKVKIIKPFTETELQDFYPLPKDWSLVKFGEVCDKIFDGTHFSPKNHPQGDYKYITAKNIKDGYLDLSNLSYVTRKDHSDIYSRCDVKKGDVLYIKDGATTGKACVNPFEEEFSLLSSVGVFRVNEKYISPKYVEHYLNAEVTRHKMLQNIAGVAITRLTLVKLNNSAFILPSKEEQQVIVSEIEMRLSVCDKVEQDIAENLEKAEALRQSILKKAFEGKLLNSRELEEVRNAPEWEPAEKLLERVKAEKKGRK